MRPFYWCVFTCSRLHTQKDICNTRILSNPVEFYSFLLATEIQTYSSSSSGRFENAPGESCAILLLYRDLQILKVILMYFMGTIIYMLQICIFLKL